MWCDKDLIKLIEIFPDETNDRISIILNKTVSSVINKANRLGLKKSKNHKSLMISKRNKMVGRNLDICELKKIASKYKTRSDFQRNDMSAYVTSIKLGVLDQICIHMINQSYSIPQLICKYIFDNITNSNGLYNDRIVIKPYELDIYYPNYKIAVEYNGNRWHVDDNTEFKRILCDKNGIELVVIIENSRNYEMDIKNQIINNLVIINKLLNRNFNKDYILNMEIDNSIFDVLIDCDNILSVIKKYDNYSEFRKNESSIYNKLIRLNRLEEFTYFLKRDRIYWNIDKLNLVILKYNKLIDLIKNDYGCYLYIKKNKLEYLISHLERCRT